MKKILSKVSVAKITKRVLFVLVLLLPLAARSGVREGSVEISPFLGINFFEQSQNLYDNLLYGGRIGYNFTDRFGVEGTLEFINTSVADRSFSGDKEGQYRGPMDKVDLFFYNLDAVFNIIPDNDFTLFVVGGFGGVNYNPSIASGDMSTFDLGLGAKFWLAENFAIRADLRDNMVTEIFHEDAFLKNAYQNINATLGLVFAFGGENAKEEAKEDAPEVIYVAEVPEPKVAEKVKDIASNPPVQEKIVVLAFEDLHFSYDKSTLSENAKAIIKRSVQILKDNPKTRIRIAGYTSAAGTEEYNQGLSERRAKVVKDYLVQEGLVSKGRLTTIGYGETKPDMHEAAPKQHYSTAAKANMRVLFEVIVD